MSLVLAAVVCSGLSSLHGMHGYILMPVASGPAGPVLAGQVFDTVFGIAHAQNSNNVRKSKNNDHACTSKCLLATIHTAFAAMLSNTSSLHVLTTSTSCVDSNHLTVDRCRYTWGRRWSLTTPPEGRTRASNIIVYVWCSARGWLRQTGNIAACSLRP